MRRITAVFDRAVQVKNGRQTVVQSSIRSFTIVNNTVRYGRNTAHTKGVKYDEKRPFTAGRDRPG